jgi:cobalt/nickel transport system permease protein
MGGRFGSYVTWDARRLRPEPQALLAVVAAAQAKGQTVLTILNFPVAAGTSGHFLGALLAAVLLGPWNACLVLAVVLTLQCLLFYDGGLTALGSNLLNMGLVGGVGAYGVFALLRAVLPKTRACFLAAAALAAWVSVVAGAACCAVELSLSGTVPLKLALPAMAGVHAVIGIGEAFITSAVLSVVLAARPDLVGAWSGSKQQPELQGA